MIQKSMNRCKATRPFRSSRSATAVQPVARLFVITRLNSHEPSVEVATSTTPVGSVNSSPEDLSADVSPGVTLATATSTVPPSVPGLPSNSRRSLQAAAGRKLWYPSRDALRYLDGRWVTSARSLLTIAYRHTACSMDSARTDCDILIASSVLVTSEIYTAYCHSLAAIGPCLRCQPVSAFRL